MQMATRKKRITISLPVHVYETLSRLSALQKRPMSSTVTELLEGVHMPLMRTVALLEAASEAPKHVREQLIATASQLEDELQDSVGGSLDQIDWVLSGRDGLNPRVVTRGSGIPDQPEQNAKKTIKTRG
jgi:hypothetical protein